ncbi:MAG: hypothetical protein ACTXOO_01510 [Sodalis sp. (in: enterobacteria)]
MLLYSKWCTKTLELDTSAISSELQIDLGAYLVALRLPSHGSTSQYLNLITGIR